jgi:hypothetical protein
LIVVICVHGTFLLIKGAGLGWGGVWESLAEVNEEDFAPFLGVVGGTWDRDMLIVSGYGTSTRYGGKEGSRN